MQFPADCSASVVVRQTTEWGEEREIELCGSDARGRRVAVNARSAEVEVRNPQRLEVKMVANYRSHKGKR